MVSYIYNQLQKGFSLMKIAILDKGTLGSDINLTPLRALGETAEYESTAPADVASRIADADVVVINKVKLNGTNLPLAKNLKLICVAATGYDNIDTAYCCTHGIALCNVPGYSTESVAQLTLAMALALTTNLTQYRGVANKVSPVFHEISSMTWGIVGGGGIGARVAGVAKALGCRVIVCRRKKEEVYEQMELDELIECADIISLHVPLTEETRGMLNRERIAKMKKGAILINVARGAVADEAALAEAVESGHLGGLGIDVYSAEPFSAEHPFTRILGRENVCLTPHMAWGAYEARNRCVEEIGKNVFSFFAGEIRNRIV